MAERQINNKKNIGREEIAKRLESMISHLEDHLEKYEHLIEPRPLKLIKNQLISLKRELEKRRNYPM